MTFNLTEKQKALARFIVEAVRDKGLSDTFTIAGGYKNTRLQFGGDTTINANDTWTRQDLEILAQEELLMITQREEAQMGRFGAISVGFPMVTVSYCTLKGRIYTAVDSNFLEDQPATVGSVTKALLPRHLPNTAFIMMWMDEKHHPELQDVCNAIKEVCEGFGIQASRADDIEHQDTITDTVLQKIRDSEFLIADLSGERPNVYYEVGFAHAIGKHPILYRKEGTQLHFDLSVHNVPEYKNLTDLRDKLTKRFEAMLGRTSSKS